MNVSEATCAWATWPPSTIAFCEARLCGFPAEPANAWSNLAYVLAGIYVLVWVRRHRRRPLWPAGVTAIGIGIGSFAFHAFPTFYTEYADLVSMFLLSTYMLAVQLFRVAGLTVRQAVGGYAVMLLVCCVSLWIHKDVGIAIFGVQLAMATAIEGVLYLRHPTGLARPRYRDFWGLIGVFLLSLTFWMLDLTGLVCDPDNHWLQGHALWHVTNSTCLIWMVRFASQFEWARSGAARRGDAG